ncbi:MAG: signal peptide peptidase SppA [Leptospiraceae bacterium]|nr:signal peptide peptidase SppA [Leptospiraceae bacterium]MCK6381648.1 signal peptide peptidase SppA [Leptospiraceae bacterium]NUM41082.1 signal peptide peptidase SppA [Leptospiraceae bacterium]
MIIRIFFLTMLLFIFQNCITVFDGGGQTLHLQEFVLAGRDTDKIVIIPIEGVISEKTNENFFGIKNDSIVSKIKEQLKKVEFDNTVKGVILKINSPGGTVTASDILFNEIKKFKKRTNLPVVSVFMDTSASGAYYIAMASDFICAHPTTVTGSIGVIMQGFNIKEGLEKIGVKDQSFTSGANKSIGSSTREMTAEQKKILQSVIDSLYNRFFHIVKEGRPSIQEDILKTLADGRIFTAEQALKNGLIDKVGYFDEFISDVMARKNYRKSPGNNNPRIVVYSTERKIIKNIYQVKEVITSNDNFINKFIGMDTSFKFMYLWNP